MKKLLSPHTILTSIAFIVAFVFPYERVTAAVDASAISRYDNATIKHFTSTIDYVNDYRSHHGRSALFLNDTLNEAARLRAEEIARTGMFTHFDENGHTFYKYFTYISPRSSCENLSKSIGQYPQTAFMGWKRSSSHDACLLASNMDRYGFAQIETRLPSGQNVFISVLIAGDMN